MKRLIAFLTLAGMLTLGITNVVLAQDEATGEVTTTEVDSTATNVDTTAVAVEEPVETMMEAEPEAPQTFHQILKEKFIQGQPLPLSLKMPTC